jgi:hypothetical protein
MGSSFSGPAVTAEAALGWSNGCATGNVQGIEGLRASAPGSV